MRSQHFGGHPPRYPAIVADLSDRIVHGEFRPGAKLPTLAALRLAYGVAIPTARKALRQLESADSIRVIAGHGSYVAWPEERVIR